MSDFLTLFQEQNDQLIESVFTDITPSSISILSTLQLDNKSTYYLLCRSSSDKYRFSLDMCKENLYPGWNRYDLSSLDRDKNVLEEIGCNPMDLKEQAKERMKEYALITPDTAPATRYSVPEDAGIDVGVSTFGTRSYYEFRLEDISKTGMLVSSGHKSLPFRVSTLVEINVCFEKDGKYSHLKDTSFIGKVAKVKDCDLEDGKSKKFVGISISQGTDLENWEALISKIWLD